METRSTALVLSTNKAEGVEVNAGPISSQGRAFLRNFVPLGAETLAAGDIETSVIGVKALTLLLEHN